MSEWQHLNWGDIATLEYGKSLRDYRESQAGVRVFGTNGPIGWHNEALSDGPGVIIGRKGAYRGIHFSESPFFVIDTAFYLRPKTDFDMRWAYYQLLVQDINSMDSGSAIPSTSRDSFYQLPVLVPALDEQRAIAHILGTLDDKIELNRRMNQTLEAIAQAIFKSWFVDFDPVRAKAEGRQPYGMDAATAALFPDGFEESELGEVPRGWRVAAISDTCIYVQNGGTPKRSVNDFWVPKEVSWLTSREVRQPIVIATENMISKLGLESSSAKIWPKYTTVVALYGATAGQVCLTATELCANQACCGLVPMTEARFYNYLYASYSVDTMALQARGSAQQNLSQQLVSNLAFVIPSKEVLDSFDKTVEPLFSKWIANLQQCSALAALRDTLLPKLLSGEVRVKEAEKIVEGV